MPESRVRAPSREELRAQRNELVSRTGRTREELEERATAGTLDADEFWLWEDIRAMEFLLGDDVER